MRLLVLTAALAVWTAPMAAQTPRAELLMPPASPPPVVLVPQSPVPAVIPPESCAEPVLPKQWTGGFDFGFNGTDGNAQNANLRLYAETKRERADSIWTANVLYTYGTANGIVTTDRLLFNTKYEWLLGPSPWSYWWSGGAEYDQFRAFDVLLFTHVGMSYAWWKNDGGFLKTRAGFGGSYPIGGPDEQFTPEALLGLDYEQKLWDRSKFVLGATVFPDLGNWFEYRAEVRAALETVIDPERNIALKLGVVERYVSQPQGRRPNDVEYFAALAWKY